MTAAPAIRLVDEALPHGITLSCRRAGADTATRRVVLLHGFPEAAFVWDGVMAALAPEALCVAPNLRGYERSSRPAEVEAYRPKHLVADIVALIERLGGPLDLLVAHDWGGGVAWNLAALRPDLMKRLVILNAPHPGTFVEALRRDAAQQAASAYMRDLVQPGAAAQLARDDFAALFAKFLRDGRRPAWLTEAVKDQYRAVWRQGLDGALNFYRASPLRPPTGPGDAALDALVLPDSVLRVTVPTTVLWGEQDHALRPVLLDGLDRWVPDLTVHRRPDASHWIVHEAPDWVIARLREALASVG